ncbi:MAG: phosphoglucomutase/phosphomannomutase family protein, partial [Trichodesmium sp.]
MTKPIKFGTDGWRGVIADDFTFERVALVAPIAARILEKNYADSTNNSKTVIVGYDRRFMAEEFAQLVAEAVQKVGFDVLLTDTYAPTPAFSLAAFQKQALGAIVMTASHNPGKYLGLKVKGAFGGSVPPEITKQIEDLLTVEAEKNPVQGTKIESFNPWPSYCETLQKMVEIEKIKSAVNEGNLKVFVDVMHGAAAGGLQQILGVEVTEVNGDRDPLFDGGAPEPLPRYLSKLFKEIKSYRAANKGSLAIGLV